MFAPQKFLFVLAGFAVYAELARGRSKDVVRKMIRHAAEDTLKHAGKKP